MIYYIAWIFFYKSIIFFKEQLPTLPSPPPLEDIKTEISVMEESPIIISDDDEAGGSSETTYCRRTGGDPAAIYYVVDLVCYLYNFILQ